MKYTYESKPSPSDFDKIHIVRDEEGLEVLTIKNSSLLDSISMIGKDKTKYMMKESGQDPIAVDCLFNNIYNRYEKLFNVIRKIFKK